MPARNTADVNSALLDDVYQRAKAILSTLVALRGQMIHLDVITRLSRPREEAKRIEGELASGLRELRELVETSEVRPGDVHALTTAFDGSAVEKVHEVIHGRSYHDIVFKMAESAIETIAETAAAVKFADAAAGWFDTIRFKQERLGQLLDEEFARAATAIAAPAGQSLSGDVKPNGSTIVSANENRNKWIYGQAVKGTPWQTIKNRLAKKKRCRVLESIPGLRSAAKGYAQRHGLPPIPARKSGRPIAKK